MTPASTRRSRQQGMDRPTYRKAVKRDLESTRILAAQDPEQGEVSDEDVKNYWQTHPQEFRADEEVRVRHIFLAAHPGRGSEPRWRR